MRLFLLSLSPGLLVAPILTHVIASAVSSSPPSTSEPAIVASVASSAPVVASALAPKDAPTIRATSVETPPNLGGKIETPALPPEIPRCAVDARVVLLAADPQRPERSMAVVEAGGTKSFVRPGEGAAGLRVIAIGPSRVLLATRGRTLGTARGLCFVDDERATAKPTTTAGPLVTAGPSDVASRSRSALPPELARGIVRVDDGHVKVDRSTRDALLDSPTALAGSAQVAPDLEGGKVVGFKLASAPKAGLFAALGLRAGDSIRTINGIAITGPDAILEAYGRLRTAPRLEVAIVRGGAKSSLVVEIV